jgi:outer membrane protein assembly factor BamB
MSEIASPALELGPAPTAPQLRLRIPIVILALLWGIPFVLEFLAPDSIGQFFFSRLILPNLCLLVLIGWWMLAKAVPSRQRWLVVVGLIVTVAITRLMMHKSMNEMSLMMSGAPAVVTLWCIWILLTTGLRMSTRTAGVLALNALTGLALCLLRNHGVTGSFSAEFDWRWQPSPEERLLAAAGKGSTATEGNNSPADSFDAMEMLQQVSGDWAEFRGSLRDGIVSGLSIETSWQNNRPKLVWKDAVGPGWSSMIVVNGRLFTQDQLGPEERVICRDAVTGEVIWIHAEPVRFEEPVAGAGPRGTPTFSDGWLYVQGASGIVTCLNAATGAVKWNCNLVELTAAKIPEWGFSSSPLVHHGQVTVFCGAPGKALISFNAETGDTVWTAGEGALSYCSAQISVIHETEQLLFCSDQGLISCEPISGKRLWQHDWPTSGIARIVQPCVLENGDVLIGTGLGVGLRRVSVSRENDTWSAKEVWTTTRCKPYFNDFVIHQNHLYGFDGAIFMCVNLDKGDVVWRARGYGSGQVLLLEDQAILLVLTETGEIAAVSADPSKHRELSRIPALEGKTWNHPIVAHGRLYVRNGAEMACFDLPMADEGSAISPDNL